ncbi:CBS domain-containing protein [bacterium]|nr:CBS domain-containing protein [bacterium]
MQIITTHINADFDSLGSMIAALKLYPKARLLFSGSQEKNVRDFLAHSPLELPFLKIKAVDWSQVKQLIIVDTRSLTRLGEVSSFIKAGRMELHIYDHHPPSSDDVSGKLEHIEEIGATTTLFTELLRERAIAITPDEATAMALAIYEDTGNFIFSSTRPRDLQAASFLIEQGADLACIAQFTQKDMTPEHIRILNKLIDGLENIVINGQAITIATASIEDYFSDLAVLAHKLDAMFTISVLFLIVRLGDRMSFIARSRVSHVDVSYYAKAFGGGGHPSAASASIRDLTLIEARQQLLRLLSENIPHQLTARDIMSSPVWTVFADDSLAHAAVLMNQYSINTLPVEDNDYLVGLISRQIVDKAIYHKLSDHLVRDYMSTEIYPVEHTALAIIAQQLMIANNTRFLPVVEEKKVVGVITRTDILRRIYDENVPENTTNSVAEVKTRKNIRSLLRERISEEILQLLIKIGEIGDKCSINVYVVGGFVRDLFLRVENSDIDIVIEGEVVEFTRQLAAALGARVKVHKKFETAVIICPDGYKFDVATARTEFYPKPAALPKIQISSLKQDLYRRDFTINTLAMCLNRHSFGDLLDFFGSQRDIKEKTIRVLHGLSFIEDPSRIFRAIRFESRFDCTIGKQTLHFIETAVSHHLIKDLSGKRMMHELKLMLLEVEPLKPLLRMKEFDVLRFVLPGIILDRIKPLFKRIQEVLLWYNLLYSDSPLEGWMVYFIGLVHDCSVLEIQELSHSLEIPKRLRVLIDQAKNAERIVLGTLEDQPESLPSALYRLLKPYALEAVLFFMAKSETEKIKRHISHYITYLRWQTCFISGKDLIKLGIPRGPIYQEIIAHILDLQLDGLLHSRHDALLLVQEKYLNSPKYRT